MGFELARRASWRVGAVAVSVLAFSAACSDDDAEEANQATSVAVSEDTEEGALSRVPDVYRMDAPSVVTVLSDTGVGSDVIWSADGLIVTTTT